MWFPNLVKFFRFLRKMTKLLATFVKRHHGVLHDSGGRTELALNHTTSCYARAAGRVGPSEERRTAATTAARIIHSRGWLDRVFKILDQLPLSALSLCAVKSQLVETTITDTLWFAFLPLAAGTTHTTPRSRRPFFFRVCQQ
jgi:hypothetical protein